MKMKYTSEKQIINFFETYRNKETKLLRLVAYFEDVDETPSINNIAEFETLESDTLMGIFTKNDIRAWVKRLIKDMFDCGCWIEVEEANYEGHH